MAVRRMDHVGIVVEDLAGAIDFFVLVGLELEGEASVGGEWAGRVIGLEGVRSDIAMLRTPDGTARVELSRFHSPTSEGDGGAPANARGIRHIAFAVEDVEDLVARLGARGFGLVGEIERFEDSYRVCYVRGPEGILVELAEEIGRQ